MIARLIALVLLAALLPACSEARPRDPSGRTELSPESGARPGDGGALDAVADRLDLTGAPDDSFVYDLVLDAEAEPVVYVSGEAREGGSLLRPTRTQGWTELPLDGLGADPGSADLAGAVAGTVVLVGLRDGLPTVFRIADDATVTSVPVEGAPAGTGATAVLSADGRTVYVRYADAGDTATVAAVDPGSGAVRASAAAPPGALVGLAGTHPVFLAVGAAQDHHAEITLLTDALQPAGSAEVDQSYVSSAGGAGTIAYAGVLAADPSSSLAEVRLLAVPAGADEGETVWSVDDALLVAAISPPVVDSTGVWAYLPSEQIQPGGRGLALRITPIALGTGEAAGSVTLCTGHHLGGQTIAADDSEVVVAVRCDDSRVPTLFTLR